MEGSRTRSAYIVVYGGLLLWLAAVIVASLTGWLGSLSPLAPPPIAALSILIPSLCIFLIPGVRAYLATVGLRRLTLIHALRITAVPLFFWYGAKGLLPITFVNKAAYGDLAAGLLALTVVLFWSRPAGYWTMHVLGMLDFVTAFATAIALTWANPGVMHPITSLPLSLIPFFGVGVFATIHVFASFLLTKGSRAGQQERRQSDSLPRGQTPPPSSRKHSHCDSLGEVIDDA